MPVDSKGVYMITQLLQAGQAPLREGDKLHDVSLDFDRNENSVEMTLYTYRSKDRSDARRVLFNLPLWFFVELVKEYIFVAVGEIGLDTTLKYSDVVADLQTHKERMYTGPYGDENDTADGQEQVRGGGELQPLRPVDGMVEALADGEPGLAPPPARWIIAAADTGHLAARRRGAAPRATAAPDANVPTAGAGGTQRGAIFDEVMQRAITNAQLTALNDIWRQAANPTGGAIRNDEGDGGGQGQG